MIICAALLIQIDGLDHTTVVPCHRHSDGYILLKELGYKPTTHYEILEDGFIDHKGEFLNRFDAWTHAVECGQMCSTIKETQIQKGILFSEDLY